MSQKELNKNEDPELSTQDGCLHKSYVSLLCVNNDTAFMQATLELIPWQVRLIHEAQVHHR